MSKLTYERAHELFNYNPNTGDLIRKIAVGRYGRHKAGTRVGCINTDGYAVVMVDHILYYCHRIAWLSYYGHWPENEIDHKDKIRHHNWITNLEDKPHLCNMKNVSTSIKNKSGVRGVSWYRSIKKWSAELTHNYQKCRGGYYKSFSNAVCARLALEQALNWSDCDTLSPAYTYVKENIQNAI